MKYNININQKVLSKYEDLDIKDMAIFDYIQVMCSSVNEKIEKERFKKHTWINYERLIEDMPALRIKSRNSISKRISNLEKSGLVTTEKKMVKGHRRVFVRLTTLSDSVFVESTERVLSDEKRVRESVQDYYTRDNNTKDTNSQLIEKFDEIRIKYRAKLKGKVRGLDTEWNNFIKKNPNADEELLDKVKYGAGQFYHEKLDEYPDGDFKYVPAFEVYINQRRWEYYTEK